MTKVAQLIDKSKSNIHRSYDRLAIGREILAKAKEPKKVYDPRCGDDSSGEYVDVIFSDQFDEFYEESILLKTIYAFIADFYRSEVDEFINGEHSQYDDLRSAEDYYQDNRYEVLKDFLNNRKS